jgi:hypothetical protein
MPLPRGETLVALSGTACPFERGDINLHERVRVYGSFDEQRVHEDDGRALSFAKIFIHSVDDRRCSRDRLRNVEETVDRRGGQPCRLVEPPLKDAGPFWRWGGEPPDGRTGPIVANRLSWIRPPVGRSDGGGHRLGESG